VRKFALISVLICLALLAISCKAPEIGFHKLMQCESNWKNHNYVFFKVDSCRKGSVEFDHFAIVGYTLEKPLPGYDMNALTICESHKQRRSEPRSTARQDYSEFMVYAADDFGCPPGYNMLEKAGYTFKTKLPGSRAVYQLYRDSWDENHWGHILYHSTDYAFSWGGGKDVAYYSSPDQRDHTGLLGYFLMAPKIPIAGQANWVPLYECRQDQGDSGYDFFYTQDPNCGGNYNYGRFAYISTTPFQGSVLLSTCERVREATHRNPITKASSTRKYADRYVIQGTSCLDGDFQSEIGYASEKQIEGTSAVYRCFADEFDEDVWDHYLSFNPKCISTRTENVEQEGIFGWVPRSLPLPGEHPAQVSGPITKPAAPVQPQGYNCQGEKIRLRLDREEGFKVEGLDKRFDIKLIYFDESSAKVEANGEVSDLLKIDESFFNKENQFKLTLLEIKNDRGYFCLERSGNVCCEMHKDEKMLFVDSEVCLAERGDIVDDNRCTETVCCEWMNTKTLQTRASCSELKDSESLNKRNCPGGVANPSCDQLKEQCSQDVRFEEEKCKEEVEKIKRDCQEKREKLEGLRTYVEQLQKANNEYSSYITGGAIAGDTDDKYSVGDMYEKSPMLLIRQYMYKGGQLLPLAPWFPDPYTAPNMFADSYEPTPGYLLSEEYVKANKFSANKILRCSISGSSWNSDALWAVEKCPSTLPGETPLVSEVVGYSLKTEKPGAAEVYICREPSAGYNFLSRDRNCYGRPNYRRIGSIGFLPQKEIWAYTEPLPVTTAPSKPEIQTSLGCPSAEAERINADCEEEIAKAREKCQEVIRKAREDCASIDAEYDRLLDLAQQLQGLMSGETIPEVQLPSPTVIGVPAKPAANFCCKTRDDVIFVESSEACRAKGGSIVDAEQCNEVICCYWMRTRTMQTKAACNALEGSEILQKSECPGGVANPTCDQLKEQCSWDVSFENAKCSAEVRQIEEDCKPMHEKLRGLKIYLENLQKIDKKYSNYITGGAVAGSAGGLGFGTKTEQSSAELRKLYEKSPMLLIRQYMYKGGQLLPLPPWFPDPYTTSNMFEDSYEPKPGYLLSEEYVKANKLYANKILRCSGSGSSWNSDALWAVEKCPSTLPGETPLVSEVVGYSLKTQESGTEEVYICREPPAGNNFLSKDRNCYGRPNYRRISSIGFLPQKESLGCPPEEAAKIKADCEELIAKTRKKCQEEEVNRAREQCASIEAEYYNLLAVIHQMQGLLK